MSRLYDRLLRRGDLVPRNDLPPVVINGQNVADYFFEHDDGFGLSLAEDIPNVAPPFNAFFIEYHMPSDAWSAWRKQIEPGPYAGLAFSVEDNHEEGNLKEALEKPAEFADGLDEQIRGSLGMLNRSPEEVLNYARDEAGFAGLDALTQARIQFTAGMMIMADSLRQGDDEAFRKVWRSLNSGIRWMLSAVLFLEMPGGKPQAVHFFKIGVKEDGSVPTTSDGVGALHSGPLLDCTPGGEAFGEEIAGYNAFARPFLKAALLAVSFMHCKNVKMVEHNPPPKASRKAQRKSGVPLTKYYTLQIDPMKQALRSEGNIESLGLQRALHICRGHFVTYTEEKPMFGKTAGTFWKEPHVRGNKRRGEVVKDYSIKPPHND